MEVPSPYMHGITLERWIISVFFGTSQPSVIQMFAHAWETLPVMDEIHKQFNKKFGTDFKFPLRPKSEQKK
jgi:hypothetical protein